MLLKRPALILILLFVFINTKAQYKSDSVLFAAMYPAHLKDNIFPAFSATSTSGAQWSEKNFLNKVTLVNYWFIGCMSCMLEIPYLNALKDSVAGTGFQVLSFARNTKQELLPFLYDKNNKAREDTRALNRRDVEFYYDIIPACMQHMQKPGDGNCPYIDKPGIVAYPTTLLIDKKGVVRDIKVGFKAPASISKDGNLFNEPDIKADFDSLKVTIERLLRE